MLRFWLALIVGTIVISAGLTYLKLHRGAQMIPYPPMAEKTKQPAVEFLPDSANSKNTMEVSANLILLNCGNVEAEREHEVSFGVKNNGEGKLELSYRGESCSCATVYFNGNRVSGTDHLFKVEPGQTAKVRMVYKPKLTGTRGEAEKKRIRVTFAHNDERFSDHLQFEIVINVLAPK